MYEDLVVTDEDVIWELFDERDGNLAGYLILNKVHSFEKVKSYLKNMTVFPVKK